MELSTSKCRQEVEEGRYMCSGSSLHSMVQATTQNTPAREERRTKCGKCAGWHGDCSPPRPTTPGVEKEKEKVKKWKSENFLFCFKIMILHSGHLFRLFPLSWYYK